MLELSQDPDVLYPALCLLNRLAIAPTNKITLLKYNIHSSILRLFEQGNDVNPNVQLEAMIAARTILALEHVRDYDVLQKACRVAVDELTPRLLALYKRTTVSSPQSRFYPNPEIPNEISSRRPCAWRLAGASSKSAASSEQRTRLW